MLFNMKININTLLVGCAVAFIGGCNSIKSIGPAQYQVNQNCQDLVHCYTEVQAALDAIANNKQDGWSHLSIAAGEYFEKVTIRSGKLHIMGAGADNTRIVFNAVARDSGKYHRNGWGTPGSATLTINADTITIEKLTIENSFDYLSNDALPKGDPNKVRHSQGVALLLDIHSDRVHLNQVALKAYQDTLFANGKRAYINNSFISGSVDFIFGNGQLLIEDSEVQSRRRGKSAGAGKIQSYIAAPSTQLSQKMGIVMHRTRLSREAGVPDQSVTIARPWHPTTTFADGRYADPNAVGQVSLIDCFMEAHIHQQHWSSMGGTARDGGKKDTFTPQSSRFYESGSKGPGAQHLDIGLSWNESLSIEEAYQFMFADKIDDPSH